MCAHDWADTEEQALIAGTAAIKQLAAGRRAFVGYRHHCASYTLKKINKEKRAAQWRPADTNSRVIEYLYGSTSRYSGPSGPDGSLVLFRITKKTAKRIFYVREQERIDEHGEPSRDFPGIREVYSKDTVIGFVNRQKLEADGKVDNNGVPWSSADSCLYASLQGLLDSLWKAEPEPDLRQLKAEMVAAHPDHGGSNEAFRAAQERYAAAELLDKGPAGDRARARYAAKEKRDQLHREVMAARRRQSSP
jgi:hypothetical protein